MGNGGSIGAQSKCAPGVYVTNDVMEVWYNKFPTYWNFYNECRDKYDGGDYELLNNNYNQVLANKNALTGQLNTCNTDKTALLGQLNTCNTDKTTLTGQLNTCNTDKTAYQLALDNANANANANTNCQNSIDTAIAQQLSEDNIRCANEKNSAVNIARVQQLSEDNIKCTNEKISAVATAKAQQQTTDDTNWTRLQDIAVASGRAQQKIDDDAACYAAHPTTTKLPQTLLQQNILLQNQTISSLQKLINNKQDKLTINEPFKSQLNSQSKSHFTDVRTNLQNLRDLNNIYNKSVALSDDNYNQVAFDTYMHLQDKKINTLQQNMASITSQLGTSKNPPIKGFRNMSNSQVLNVEGYPNPTATNNGQPSTYRGNGASDYPNYLIYGNNGCLQYNTSTTSSSTSATPASYSFASCNASKPNQQFYAKQINNIDAYNAPINDINNASYKINNANNALMGFYVVNPSNASDQCLQLNNDGLSVMPCNMDSSQRFKPMYRNAIP